MSHFEGHYVEQAERNQEFLALMNMISYVIEMSQSLGAEGATLYLQAARTSMVDELRGDVLNAMSSDALARLSSQRIGHG